MKVTVLYLIAFSLALGIFPASSQSTDSSGARSFVILQPYKSPLLSFRGHSTSDLDESISHNPGEGDKTLVEKHKNLIVSSPDKHNYHTYSRVATALWNLERIAEAEKMFLRIYYSRADYYNSEYYYDSDIPGDKSKNKYGYGSFISNYKHYACRHLCEINVERKQFDTAMHFLQEADTLYPLNYNCGTGYHLYRNKMNGLYSICYRGLGKSRLMLDKYLPDCLSFFSMNVAWAIKQTYTKHEIDSLLLFAEESITCTPDTFTSYAIIYRSSGKGDQTEQKITYTSGKGTITLFGVLMDIHAPSLKEGEVISREHFVKAFRESSFYWSLSRSLDPDSDY
jgi:tetratricopeptide (TPR) repeat protein